MISIIRVLKTHSNEVVNIIFDIGLQDLMGYQTAPLGTTLQRELNQWNKKRFGHWTIIER